MPISTSCPRCKNSYYLPDAQLGKTVRCKHCAGTFVVEPEDDVPTLEAASRDEIVQARSPERSPAPPRYRDEEDDYDFAQPGGGGGLLMLALVGGFLVLLLFGGALAWYLSPGSAPPVAQQTIAPAPEPPPPEPQPAPQPQPAHPDPVVPAPLPAIPEPPVVATDVNRALTLLRDDAAARRRLGLAWLATAPVEEDRRDEVSGALNIVLDDRALRRETLRAVRRWGGKNNVPKLLPLVEELDALVWGPVIEFLAASGDEHAIEVVAQQLPALGRTSRVGVALRSASPRVAEKHVVKFLHHADPSVREEAGRLLTHYKTPQAMLLEQTASDLDGRDARTRRIACEWLARQKPGGDGASKVARTLEGLLSDTDLGVKQMALEALEQWATKDNVKGLCEALKNVHLMAGAVKILGKLESPEAIQPLALCLNSPHREAIARILIGFGAKAEKATQIQLKNGDPTTRLVACQILAEIGTKDSLTLLTQFAKADKPNSPAAVLAMRKIRERMK